MSKCDCKGLKACMCKKVAARVACYTCGYPYSEAAFPDKDVAMDCEASDAEITKHINEYLASCKD